MGNARSRSEPRVAAKKFYGRTFARLRNEDEHIFYCWILQAHCELSTFSRFPRRDACSRGRQRRVCIIPSLCLVNIWPDRLSKLPLFCVANNAQNNVSRMNFCCARRDVRLELLYGISKWMWSYEFGNLLSCEMYWNMQLWNMHFWD